MKIRGFKLLSLMLIFSLTTCLAFGIFLYTPQDSLSYNAAYVFSSGSLSSSDSGYKNNTYFEIGTKNDLINFGNSVANGCTFEGKIVSLTANINCNREQIAIGNGSSKPFCGRFDGQGFSIEYVTLKGFAAGSQTAGYYFHFGLFHMIKGNATILNLRLHQVFSTHTGNNYAYSPIMAAMVAICEGGTIENCYLDCIYFEDQQSDFSCEIAPFIGNGNASVIKNCYVQFVYVETNNKYTYFSHFGPAKYYILSNYEMSAKIENSIFNVYNSDLSQCREIYDYLEFGSDFWDNSSISGSYIKTDSTYSNLSNKSAEGGKDHSSAWYYYTGLSCPVLRMFYTDWRKVDFKSNNTSYGTVNKDSIYILKEDFINFIESNGQISGTTVTIFEQIVKASAVGKGQFVGWDYYKDQRLTTGAGGFPQMNVYSITYTANFEEKPAKYCYFNFGSISKDSKTFNPSCSTFETGTTKIKVVEGTTGNETLTHNPTNTIITYTFKLNGSTVHTVSYTVDNIYTLNGSAAHYGNLYGPYVNYVHIIPNFIAAYITNGSEISITAPSLKLKTYNTYFQ